MAKWVAEPKPSCSCSRRFYRYQGTSLFACRRAGWRLMSRLCRKRSWKPATPRAGRGTIDCRMQGRLSSPIGRSNGWVGTALAAVENCRNFRSLLLNLMKRDWGKEQILKQGPYMHILNQLVGEMMKAPEVLCNKKSMGNRVRSMIK
ncbi:unnamed protein product [Musa acuminata subsp. burmannicoides]